MYPSTSAKCMKLFSALTFLLISFFSLQDLSSKEIFIFSFNDFHGALEESSSTPGIAKFVDAMKQEKKKYKANSQNSVVLSAGDNYQGQYLSNISYGHALSPFFRELGVKLSSVGNHDLDWGMRHFDKWRKDGEFEFLAANILGKDGKLRFKPYEIITIDGVKVAFIGFSTIETPYSSAPGESRELVFQKAEDVAPQFIKELKEQGVDFIIALTHIPAIQNPLNGTVHGQEIRDLASVAGIDAILSAHSHERVASHIDGVAILQACYHGRCIGTLKIDAKSRKITPIVTEISKDRQNSDTRAEKLLEKKRKEYAATANKVIAYIDKPLAKGDLLKLMTKDIFNTYKDSNIDFVILNGGLVRIDLSKGAVHARQMYEIIPFDNTLMFLTIDGLTLSNAIKHTFSMLPIRKRGTFYGDIKKIDPKKKYRIGISNFMYPDGDLYQFKNAEDIMDTGLFLRDLLAQSLANYNKSNASSNDANFHQ